MRRELTRNPEDLIESMEVLEFGSFAFVRDNAGKLIEFVQQPDMWA